MRIEIPQPMTSTQTPPALPYDSAKQINPFFTFDEQVAKLVQEAAAITVTDATQVSEIKRSRAIRLQLKSVRCAIENARKDKVAGLNEQTKAINSAANKLKELIEPMEARLQENEDFAERAEAERIAKLKAEREAELAPVSTVDVTLLNLGAMKQPEYDALLTDFKAAHADRIARAEREAAELKAKQEAERAEQERVRIENEKLKAEVAEREKAAQAERDKAAAELAAVEQKLAAERKAAEDKLNAERKAAEDAAAKLKAETDAAAAVEREKRAAAERELVAAREAEAKRKQAEADVAEAERQRLAHEQRTRELEAQRAAQAPDREKLIALAKAVHDIPRPELTTEAGKATMALVMEQFQKFVIWIHKKAEEL